MGWRHAAGHDGLRGGSDASTSEDVDRLAKRLYSRMIKLDPIEGDPEWSELPDDERDFYRQLIEDLVRSPDWRWLVRRQRSTWSAGSGARKRRTPWVLSFIGLLLVAAVLYFGFDMR
jgi:hypothetical protein